MLVEADLATFSSAWFELAEEVPEESQHGSLVNPTRMFPAIFTAFRRLLLWDFARRSLLTRPRALTLCSVRALRARCQFGRSGKHALGHVAGDVINAGATGDLL